MIMTYPWDQNDTNDSCVPPILHVVNGDSELDEVPTTVRRVGVDINSYKSHTFLCGTRDDYNATAAGSLGMEGAVKNDIDDFIGTQTLANTASGAGGIDYIETGTVSIATGVQYISDTASYNSAVITFTPSTANLVSSSNIKAITITLTRNLSYSGHSAVISAAMSIIIIRSDTMSFSHKRSALTMIELIFVIIILGIVSSIGAEIIADTYESYIVQRAEYRATMKTELALNQIANRLRYAIPGTVGARTTKGAPFVPITSVVNPNNRVLQWVAYDGDSFEAITRK